MNELPTGHQSLTPEAWTVRETMLSPAGTVIDVVLLEPQLPVTTTFPAIAAGALKCTFTLT